MSEEETKFKTSCETCVFAEYQPSGQVGCEVDRLEKFHKQGRTELQPKGYYIIDGFCNMCRGPMWGEKHFGENLIAVAEKESQVQLDFVLLSVDDNVDTVVRRIPELVNSCLNQTVKPRNIIVVVKNAELQYQPLYDSIQELTSIYEIPFQLVRVVESDATVQRCLNMGARKCKSLYFASFTLDGNISLTLIDMLNQKINYEMQKPVMVESGRGYNHFIIQTGLYKLLNRDPDTPVYDIVRDLAKDQDREEQILTWEQLWKRSPL